MLQQWLEWHHLIFLLPLIVAVAMVLLTGLSDLHIGGADADVGEAHLHAEAGMDAHADLHAEAGFDGHPELHGEVAGDAHGDAHAHHGGEGLATLLEFFGVGHLPLSILLQAVALLWGVVGLVLIQIAPPAIAIPIAVLVTLSGARAFSVVMMRMLGGSKAAHRSQLVGKTGEVVLEVTPQFGVVHVRDDHGTLYRLNARTEAEALLPGQKIVVVGYDPQDHLYEVADPVRFLESGGK
jgi:membrane protein implicated in regulation of membrane protease activity